MKAEEVLNLLQISRKTLHVYAHDGRIRYTVMPNKRYDYSEEDVYKILNKDVKRKTVLYARVSTSKQKNDLQNQIDQMKQWCFMNKPIAPESREMKGLIIFTQSRSCHHVHRHEASFWISVTGSGLLQLSLLIIYILCVYNAIVIIDYMELQFGS